MRRGRLLVFRLILGTVLTATTASTRAG